MTNLVQIKILHTAIWCFFAGCIVAIPIVGARGHYVWAAVLIGLVLVECGVLAANRGHCPLTGMAARHTEQRSANFDIYLPVWLARYNKAIFGTLFVVGGLFVLARWWTSSVGSSGRRWERISGELRTSSGAALLRANDSPNTAYEISE